MITTLHLGWDYEFILENRIVNEDNFRTRTFNNVRFDDFFFFFDT